MLYLLYDLLQTPIGRSSWLGPLGVFRWVEFRAVLAVVFSFAFVVTLGKPAIRWLVKQKVGDLATFGHQDLDELMKQKRNTPTMGGILIAGAIFISTLLLADLSSFYVILALTCLLWLHVIGLFDDWLKLTAASRSPGSRQGLYSWEKLLCQLALGLLLGYFIYDWGQDKQHFADPDVLTVSHSLTLPFFKTWVWMGGDAIGPNYELSPWLIVLPMWAFVLLTIFMITFFSNAVNLTDGMDGLAGGITIVVAFAMLALCIIAGYTAEVSATLRPFVLAKYLLVPHVPFSDELAVVAGSMMGACLGFLWFNCSPAKVFMGDSGSLPLGGLLGYIAVVIRQEFLLFIIGGVFVMEAGSVILQVGYFKLTKGKRIFRCAPIHHHFHLAGWTEQQVVVRFWLITALLAAIALATIKLR